MNFSVLMLALVGLSFPEITVKSVQESDSLAQIQRLSKIEVLDPDFRRKGSEPKYYLEKGEKNSILIGTKQRQSLPLWGDNDVDLGEAVGVSMDVVPGGSKKGRVYAARLKKASGYGNDTIFIYYSDNGGDNWNLFKYLYSGLGIDINDFSICCSRENLCLFYQWYNEYLKEIVSVYFFDLEGSPGNKYKVFESIVGLHEMHPECVSDGEDYSDAWFYLTYSEPQATGADLMFKIVTPEGGVQSSACLDGSGSVKDYMDADMDYDDGNIFVTYWVEGDDLIRARFSNNLGSSWTNKMDVSVGGDDNQPRIAGHNDDAVVVMQDEDDGIAFTYTTNFGDTWNGPYLPGEVDNTDACPGVATVPSTSQYAIYFSDSKQNPHTCWMDCSDNNWYGEESRSSTSADVRPWAHCYEISWLYSSNDIGIIWIDDRSGTNHAYFNGTLVGAGGLPDLVISTPRPDDGNTNPPFYVGQTIDWYCTVANDGDGEASSSYVGYYLGTSSNDFSNRISRDGTGDLSPGESTDEHEEHTFTSSDIGTRYLNVWADYQEEVAEEDEGNNKNSYGPFTVIVIESPVLHLSAHNYNPPSGGGTSSNIYVTNEGSGGSIGYTISSSEGWLSTSTGSGSTPDSFQISANANTDSSSRTGYVVVEATGTGVGNSPDTVIVTQPSQEGEEIKIAIVNPDSCRIVKFGLLGGSTYYSIAYGEVADECSGGFTSPACWTGFGEQQDFIGTVLSNSGYAVDYFTPDNLPPITPGDYQVLIVQDPLKTNVREFPKEVEDALPDLLEYVLSQSFINKLKTYFNSGGNVILVGDAVRLLEDGEYRLNFGKTINTDIVSNTLSEPSPSVPSKWLFIRGNPFCGRDRYGSGTYSVEASVLLPTGTKLSDITLFDGNDLPKAATWSDVVYYPNDGISLLDVRMQGTGQYVLRGDICDPPVYTVTVDDVLSNFIGYTLYDGKKIFYIGSDTYFDYDFINHNGAWHASEYLEMKYTVTDAGKQAILNLIDSIPESGIEEELSPDIFSLSQGTPNPFTNKTTISYELGKAVDVDVSVYNMLGQKVRALYSGKQSSGVHEITWNGVGNSGEKLSSGIYFLRIEAGEKEASRKVTLVR